MRSQCATEGQFSGCISSYVQKCHTNRHNMGFHVLHFHILQPLVDIFIMLNWIKHLSKASRKNHYVAAKEINYAFPSKSTKAGVHSTLEFCNFKLYVLERILLIGIKGKRDGPTWKRVWGLSSLQDIGELSRTAQKMQWRATFQPRKCNRVLHFKASCLMVYKFIWIPFLQLFGSWDSKHWFTKFFDAEIEEEEEEFFDEKIEMLIRRIHQWMCFDERFSSVVSNLP